MAIKVYVPKIRITDNGNGTYSATMSTNDSRLKSRPAEAICWKVVAPAGFPGYVYLLFYDDSSGAKVPANGPFFALNRLDGIDYKDSANKVVQLIPGAFLPPGAAEFKYEIWHNDTSGTDKRLMDPEIVVDGEPNIPVPVKLRSKSAKTNGKAKQAPQPKKRPRPAARKNKKR